ncbi:MAG: CPBP family intramembrane glutamic endopeptidase [Candidatus Kapaibacterium sp.]
MGKPLWLYGGTAYGITWIIVLVLYLLHQHGDINRDELNLYFNLGALGPFLGAIIAASVCYGQAGVGRLFATLNPSRLEWRSTLLALSPLLLFAVGWCVHLLLAGAPFSFETTKKQFDLTTTASYLGWATPFITYGLFEELGWRGFALPHLQEKYSAFTSTIFLAIIWGLWHAPMFLIRFEFSVGISVGFFLGLFVGAIILTSIFNFSRGSTLAAIIFHLINNISSGFDKQFIVATISTGFVAIAIYLLVVFKPENLAATGRVGNYFKR